MYTYLAYLFYIPSLHIDMLVKWMTATTLVKSTHYRYERRDGCKYFCVFKTVPLKLQVILWNKQGPFKKQGCNNFP